PRGPRTQRNEDACALPPGRATPARRAPRRRRAPRHTRRTRTDATRPAAPRRPATNAQAQAARLPAADAATVSQLSLPEKIEAIDRQLEGQRIVHAFGGALALAYYAEPRATDDIDVNVFLAPKDFARLRAALKPLGITASDEDERAAQREGQVRLWWDRDPVDIFLAYHQLHETMRDQQRMFPFA